MHDQMRVRQLLVNFFDHVHGQNSAIRLARKLVGAMRCAHGNRQRVHIGFLDELYGFIWVGQQLVVAELAFKAVAIFLFAFAGFERTQNTEFTFNRNAAQMGHLGDCLVMPTL